jgi:RNA polymerase sigma-70 factor (ECF subfamily)
MRRSPAGPDSQPPSDEELVAATLRGDRHSYRTLVERYQSRIFSMAYDVVRSKEDAEDVTQESFVKAFLSLDKFKGQSSFYTWLYRIAFNMAVDVRRKTSRRGGNHLEYKESLSVSPSGRSDSTGESEQVSTLQNIEGPHEALVRKQAARKIQEVLAQLSDEHRAVITLREIDGLNYDEISEALGIPKGTVMSRLFYARKALQKALGEFAPESASTSAEGDNHEGSDSHESTKEHNERLKRNIG